MSKNLDKITALAKQIRTANPQKKWQDCIKEASAQLKANPQQAAVHQTAPEKINLFERKINF